MVSSSRHTTSERSSIPPFNRVEDWRRNVGQSNLQRQPPPASDSASNRRPSSRRESVPVPPSTHLHQGSESQDRHKVFDMETTVKHKASLEIDKNGRHYPAFNTSIEQHGMLPGPVYNPAFHMPQYQAIGHPTSSGPRFGHMQQQYPTSQEQQDLIHAQELNQRRDDQPAQERFLARLIQPGQQQRVKRLAQGLFQQHRHSQG